MDGTYSLKAVMFLDKNYSLLGEIAVVEDKLCGQRKGTDLDNLLGIASPEQLWFLDFRLRQPLSFIHVLNRDPLSPDLSYEGQLFGVPKPKAIQLYMDLVRNPLEERTLDLSHVGTSLLTLDPIVQP